MAQIPARSELHVEGSDDQHSIVHLLIRNGVPYDPVKLDLSPFLLPKVFQCGGIDRLITGIGTAVKANAGRTVGFVLDANSSRLERWTRVAAELEKGGVGNLPPSPRNQGFIGESASLNTRVGVWMMPDNLRDGKLEDFLMTLIDANDPLIDHARVSTGEAKARGASFSDPDALKATIHAWLAWQIEPGLPYGTAVKARYFSDDSPAAAAFVDWFKSLYKLA